MVAHRPPSRGSGLQEVVLRRRARLADDELRRASRRRRRRAARTCPAGPSPLTDAVSRGLIGPVCTAFSPGPLPGASASRA